MALRPVRIAVDARDDCAVGRFWATVKNRVHLDFAVTSAEHQADLVARLRELGATPVDLGQGDVSWTVLADPEGSEFEVLAPR